ncbi:hypothetical protein KDK95_11945, partial [Actinospica sp. MGRD01-02]
MIRRSAAIVAAALVVAASSGTAGAATVRSSLQTWQTTVFALGPNDSYVAEWNGPGLGWTEIGGPANQLYVGSAGVFATDPSTGDISQYNGTPGSWTVIGGPGWTFAQSGGHLFGVGPYTNYIAEWNGASGGWTIIYSGSVGSVTDLEGGGEGLVATIGPSGPDTYMYNGTPGSWTQISGSDVAFDHQLMAVDDGGVYVLNAAGQVEQWAGYGESWTVLGSGYKSLFVGGTSGNVYAAATGSGNLQQYTGTPGSWTTVGGPGYMFAVSRSTLYGLAPDRSYVAEYTPGAGCGATPGWLMFTESISCSVRFANAPAAFWYSGFWYVEVRVPG